MRVRALQAAAFVVAASLLTAGCSAESDKGGSTAKQATTDQLKARGTTNAPLAVQGGAGSSGADQFANATAAVPRPGGKSAAVEVPFPGMPDRVVKNAELTVQVKKGAFDDAWNKALQTANRFTGYVASSQRNVSDAGDEKDKTLSGKLSIRVPARRFEETMVALRGLGKVLADTSTSDDVTEEFVDLESRLRNFRAQQAVLIRLMDKARNVNETLQVQSHLATTQAEIERITGRLNALKSLTEMSTINLNLGEPGIKADAKIAATPPSRFEKAWNIALDGLTGIGTVLFVGTIWAVPLLLLGLGVFLLSRRFLRRPEQQTPAET